MTRGKGQRQSIPHLWGQLPTVHLETDLVQTSPPTPRGPLDGGTPQECNHQSPDHKPERGWQAAQQTHRLNQT